MPAEQNDVPTISLPVVLRARFHLGLLILCVVLISLGVAASSNERYMEIAFIAVIAGVVGLLQHFPGLSTLTIDDHGFKVKNVFGTRAIAWREAHNFRPIRKRRTDLVTWDVCDGAPRRPASHTQMFAYWQAYDAAALAALMNRIRQQVVASSD